MKKCVKNLATVPGIPLGISATVATKKGMAFCKYWLASMPLKILGIWKMPMHENQKQCTFIDQDSFQFRNSYQCERKWVTSLCGAPSSGRKAEHKPHKRSRERTRKNDENENCPLSSS